MKHVVVLAVWLVPAAALAQEAKTYTNADLVKIEVPGAYTNQDLKRLPPLAVQRVQAPAAPRGAAPVAEAAPAPPTEAFQAYFNSVRVDRDVLMSELQYEIDQVAFSESAFAGDTRSFDVRLGYRAQARPLIQELAKRVALLDMRLDAVADEARKAGVSLDRR
ncbi:MAG TPA: hypothetical protein VGS03_18205 [Candidatus Polarisedimenticolia bacterium]|jgi:hypothetical protein|nr:hypothetical protein [Candidatus Polarisedimenticolia bacterium]